jgi:hypothetical protein
MSKTMEELVIVGVIALFALKFLQTGAATSAAVAYQNSTLGQTAGFASVGEGILTSIGNFSEAI